MLTTRRWISTPSFADVYDFITTTLGWTHVADISSTEKICKSQGEGGLFAPVHLRCKSATNQFGIRAALYYNNGGGDCKQYHSQGDTLSSYGIYLPCASGQPLVISGSKDFIFAANFSTSPSHKSEAYLGFPKTNILGDFVTTLSQSVTSGTNKQITAVSTTGFRRGRNYFIIGASGEGRDYIQVLSIDSSTQMTVANVPRNYGSGAFIGPNPCSFVSTLGDTTSGAITMWNPVCPRSKSGLTDCDANDVYTFEAHYTSTLMDTLGLNQPWGLSPVRVYESGSNFTTNPAYIGSWDNYLLLNTSLTKNDYVTVNPDSDEESGLITSVTTTDVTDNTKSWTTNQWADKVCVIVDGSAAGHTRVIQSNTSTTLTLYRAFDTDGQPAVGAAYQIVDKVFRCFAGGRAYIEWIK